MTTLFIARLFLMACLLALPGCGASGAAQAGGTDNGSYGHVRIGLPF